ncbi:hypothetical protein ACJIZ3_009685 [Penstemon smallii]|uniref:CBF1-interacting co-repressor CIR N-terminal domain-containing protein n=1 Tax=Penstemon smallii TaxID=265156 RepID=A0ABD3TD83_9LAMI
MGGHGGLNILPQKRWNVYNFDNREKVRLDEEAAAKEEQIKREQSRKRDMELRLEKLRQARGLASGTGSITGTGIDTGGGSAEDTNSTKPSSTASIQTLPSSDEKAPEKKSESDSKHINLFEGIRIFDPIKAGGDVKGDKKKGKFEGRNDNKKVKKEEVRVVGPEDEVYRLGYGVAGKGVKLPWYMEKKVSDVKNGNDDDDEYYDHDYDHGVQLKKRKTGGKKTLEELREERLKRERIEKERERALFMDKSRRDGGFSSRRR